jgi:hypothetical protein
VVTGVSDESTNSAALDTTLQQLKDLGRLEEIDAARVQMLRTMAATLDEEPARAALWKEYRASLKELMADDSSSGLDDALAGLFADVRNPPPA